MNYENKKVVLKNRPNGYPKLDDFDIVTEEILKALTMERF